MLEYIPGGSLKSRLRRSKTRRLDETETKIIFAQLVMAVSEMHRQAVIHRDIKVENILFDTEGNVRLIDFGLSACGRMSGKDDNLSRSASSKQQDEKSIGTIRARSETFDGAMLDNPEHVSTYTLHTPPKKLSVNVEKDYNTKYHVGQLCTNKSTPVIPSPKHGTETDKPAVPFKARKPPIPRADMPLATKVEVAECESHSINLKKFAGTPLYMAPEVLDRKGYNGRPVDVWSVGVLLFLVLCGRFPFKDVSTVDDLKHIVKQGLPPIPKHFDLSNDVVDLLQKVLCVNPTKRITIGEVLCHNWLRETVVEQMRKSDATSSKMSHSSVMMKMGKSGFGLDESAILDALENKSFNHFSACYHLTRLNANKSG